jgi:hypothetical protein
MSRLHFLVAAALVAACGDAGAPSRARPVGGAATQPAQSTTSGTEPEQATADAGPIAPLVAQDAAPSPDAGPVDAFTGAPAFTPGTGASTRQTAHDFTTSTPPTNPAKQACLTCHTRGGPAPAFAMAGTIFQDAAGTVPAVGVEVRVYDAKGATMCAYTDADGNFFFRGAPFAAPAYVGVRDALRTHLMTGTITSGDCNNATCHGGLRGVAHIP